MIRKLYYLTRGHYNVAKVYKNVGSINHEPTYYESFIQSIVDLVKYKVDVDSSTGSYIVYQVIKKHALRMSVANLISIYVPKEHRGKNIAKILKNKIVLPLIEPVSEDRSKRYNVIGYLCVTNQMKEQ